MLHTKDFPFYKLPQPDSGPPGPLSTGLMQVQEQFPEVQKGPGSAPWQSAEPGWLEVSTR